MLKESEIEEDIKRCEELIKPEHENWIGISNQLSIVHLIERIKELEAKLEFKKLGEKELEAKLEFKKLGELDNTQFEEYMNQFISKQKVKDLIKDEIINISGFECIAIEELLEEGE